MAAGLPLPKQIIAHAHWTKDAFKMSKSRGNVVDPYELLDKFGVDPVRYYLVRDGGIANDGAFSLREVIKRYKKDLAGQLGNLVMRCSSKKVNPKLEAPHEPGEITAAETEIIDKLTRLRDEFTKNIEQADYAMALEGVYETVSEGNRYFQTCEPWAVAKAAKKEGSVEAQRRLQTILFFTFETVRIAALLLQSVVPSKMQRLLGDLGVDEGERTWENAVVGKRWRGDVAGRMGGTKIAKMEPLFPPLAEEEGDEDV
ncbi:methionyl-tRNA synthetase [Rhizophlyctis rosea]|nr:methionyl-tRNA synthetase [Rhizophlyctis rosea]